MTTSQFKQVQAVRLETIPQLTGGATASIFPEVEKLLFQREYQDALLFVARHKSMRKYRSVMDFIFCELHTEWRRACHRYYTDKGQPLRNLITPRKWELFNERMLAALEIAHKLHQQQRCRSWSWYCEMFEESLISAT